MLANKPLQAMGDKVGFWLFVRESLSLASDRKRLGFIGIRRFELYVSWGLNNSGELGFIFINETEIKSERLQFILAVA